MALPKFPTDDMALSLLQTQWSSTLNPIISLPQNNSLILTNIILSSSSIINHKLGRNLIGWEIIRQRGKAQVYDTQDTNPNPSKTLTLVSSSGISVDLLVF